MDRFLGLHDAAEYLRLSYMTVYRLVRAGKIPAGKLGGMYRIRKEDLDTYFSQQVSQTAERSQPAGAAERPDRCGSCYRLVAGPEEAGGRCAEPGCGQAICSRCWSEGRRHCQAHQPSNPQHLAEAQQALARGELPCVVSSLQARLSEQAWLARFDERMASIASLYHPGSQEVLQVPDWEQFHLPGDETLQLMQMLNLGFLDRATQSSVPHNERSRYHIPAGALGRGRPKQALLVEARHVGHLPAFVRDGFDTRPGGLQELATLLGEAEALAGGDGATYLLGLASPTGWEAAAIHLIEDDSGRGYRHRFVLPCLADLGSGALCYNRLDERLARLSLAELFKLPLEAEEVAGLKREIQALLAQRTGLPVADLAERLGRPAALVQRACQALAGEGGYVLKEEKGLGPVLLHRPDW